jgi:TatA/E family protein of Tat protein translocase
MSFPGGTEMLIVLAVVILLFGAKKVPELARSMGRAKKEFSSGLKEGAREQKVEGPCPFCEKEVPAGADFCPGCAKSAAEITSARTAAAPVAVAS